MVFRVALVTVLALLFCACVNGQTAEEYAAIARLDDCGQSCNSSCEATDGVCRCDRECERYGDCCSSKVDCDGGEQRTQPLAGLQCRSIHFNSSAQPDKTEAFWMVSACPEDWLTEQEDEELREADEKCRNGSDTLPPVMDLDSGVVYKNEYCAVCHQVDNIQMWEEIFRCTSGHIDAIIIFTGVNLTEEIVQRECMTIDAASTCSCIACGFRAPQTELPPRMCLHGSLVTGDCLDREQLEEKTGFGWEEEVYQDAVMRCRTSPTSPVSSSPGRPYRNQYCAICNGERTAQLSCADPYAYRNLTNYCFRPEGGGEVIIYNIVSGGVDIIFTPDRPTLIPIPIPVSCPEGEVFDTTVRSCRQTICSDGFVIQEGPFLNITLTGMPNSTNDSRIVCDGECIVLDEDEFTLVDNETLLFRKEGMFEILGYNDSSPIICSNFTQNGTTVTFYSYPSAFSILTYVGCSLSVIGCVVVLLTYSLFKELRSLPGQILMNLVSTVLAFSLIFLFGIPLAAETENDKLCEATAILLHWLVLSQFSWMSTMSFELLRTLYRATQLRPVEEKSRKKRIFLLYFLIGWGIPTAITVICVIVNYTTDLIGYGEDGFCWISHDHSFYTVFVAPVVLSIIFNGITFTVTVSLLFKASREQAKLNKQQSISYLRVSFCIFSISGLTWIFGFLAILIRDDWAWYTTIVLISTQGFVICTAFIFTQKIGTLYKTSFISTLSSREKTSSKNSAKQQTQKTLLPVKDSRKSENDRFAQDDGKPTERAMQDAKKQNGDHKSIELDNIQRPLVTDQEIADESTYM